MAILIFLGILIGAAALIVGITYLMRPAGRVVPLVYLGTPTTYLEQVMWLEALKSAGIRPHVENPIPPTAAGVYSPTVVAASISIDAELWVREEDYEGARAILGFDEPEPERRTKRARFGGRRRPRPLES